MHRQRALLDAQAKALLAPLRAQWEQHTAALLAGGEGWARRGAAAAAALSAARELMHVLQVCGCVCWCVCEFGDTWGESAWP